MEPDQEQKSDESSERSVKRKFVLPAIPTPSTHSLMLVIFGAAVLSLGFNDFATAKQIVCFLLDFAAAICALWCLRTVYRRNKAGYENTILD